MNVMYNCTFCGKAYSWYDGVYENPNYDYIEKLKAEVDGEKYTETPGGYIKANGFLLKEILPFDDHENGGPLKANDPDGELKGLYINICPDCMRELLGKTHIEGNLNAWNLV